MKRMILLMLFSGSITFAADKECKNCDQFYGWYNMFRYACRQTNKSGPEFRRDVEIPVVATATAVAVAAVALPLVAGPAAATTVVAANVETVQAAGVASAGIVSWLRSGKETAKDIAKSAAITTGEAFGKGREVHNAIHGIREPNADGTRPDTPMSSAEQACELSKIAAQGAVGFTTSALALKAASSGIDMVTGKAAQEEEDRRTRLEQAQQLIEAQREVAAANREAAEANRQSAEAQREVAFYSERNVKMSAKLLKEIQSNPEKLLQFPDEKKE